MDSNIYVITRIGSKQSLAADEVFELFGCSRVDNVSDMSEEDIAIEKETFVQTMKEVVGDAFVGDADKFSFAKDVAKKYAERIMPIAKKAMQDMTLDDFADSYADRNLLSMVLPYNYFYIVTPGRCDSTLDVFLRSDTAVDGEFYVETIFDYHR